MAVYTLGIWRVKTGSENEFIRAWRDLAIKTKEDFPDEVATLLQDRDDPSTFISFGPWESQVQIDQWRRSDTFKEGVSEIRSLLEEFTPHTMDVAVSIE
jgi:heme-degrading monooxygenase HmoA